MLRRVIFGILMSGAFFGSALAQSAGGDYEHLSAENKRIADTKFCFWSAKACCGWSGSDSGRLPKWVRTNARRLTETGGAKIPANAGA